jgi:Trehalase
MTVRSLANLAQRALDVLECNRRGPWTCPSAPLYPHQWLWDSCFVAIGLAHHDPSRAAGELRSLFRGQWANGMLPNIIFAEDVRDAGSRRLWQSRKHPDAPGDVETSCITQPPLPGVAVWYVAQELRGTERQAFLAELFPRLVDYHHWLYRERDPGGRGLVTLIHPWECGLDTTPPWMEELRRMPTPWWLRLVLRLGLARVVRSLRRDTRYAPASERPTDGDGLRMLVLARRAKRYGFELGRLPRHEAVLIEDLAFNALLAVSNRSLVGIAHDLDITLDPQLETSFRKTERAIEQLWDESTGQYYSRNAVTAELIKLSTAATFLPLWAGVPSPQRAARLVARLHEHAGFWPSFPVPSVPTDAPQFEPHRYWKGPTWVNINWVIIEGLRAYGETDVADEVRRRTIDLVDDSEFAEYFSALSGEGLGVDGFSWTAALALDLLESRN